MKITIVGLGLIGGCISMDLRKASFASELLGIDLNPEHGRKALELGLVDRMENETIALTQSDVIILAIPVNTMSALLPQVLDVVKKNAVVIDAGSTKSNICKSVSTHPKRSQFVAAHPIAGTENSGPESAFHGLFMDKTNIICESEKSSKEALELAIKIFNVLGMNTIFMDPEEHDKHVAYVS
ncbi:MAG TPA: prephenate dehydrogenase/arogenate dehydrogenase family protein, partial [Cyclobacteriaceae bacterium]|nr:prephenate dehydrogenase/arogenate dehydrogenase family protein [Cyclobacteriaceae bacterium]